MSSVMEITTGIGCKVACTYCPQDRLIKAYRGKSSRMSLEAFKTCVDKIPPAVDIHFSGMYEPMLNPDWTRMLLYAHERGHLVKISSTLAGMNSADIDLLETIPLKNLKIHLPADEERENIKVDENYLQLFNKLVRSSIKIKYSLHGERIHSRVKPFIGNKDIKPSVTCSRAGNKEIDTQTLPRRKRGVICCRRELRHNVLLPDGEVILCCMDYGMRHVLGNLVSSDYDSLFRGREFLSVEKGLTDESLDILCRRCEMYAYNVSLSARAYNSFLPRLRQKL
ncbi:MAG: SPASM domain-containing protein [bacterium]